MNTFMKIKMAASWYPSQCDAGQEKTSTLNEYEPTKGLLCVQMTFHSIQDVVQSLNFASIIYNYKGVYYRAQKVLPFSL